MLGKDGKPFKTREGETVRLEDLLDEAVERATAVVAEKGPDAERPAEIAERAQQVGIGAIKYADLSTSLGRDYVFDLDRMVSLNGDTSVYLQYAYARIQLDPAQGGRRPRRRPTRSCRSPRRSGRSACTSTTSAETVAGVAAGYEPHKLASYLYQLASAFTTFYDQCPVLKAQDPATVENRLFLCDLTGADASAGNVPAGHHHPRAPLTPDAHGFRLFLLHLFKSSIQ